MRKMERLNTVLKIPSEHVEQRNFVSWFRKTYPEVRIFAIPNGEKRSKSVACRLKVEGVSPGVPDLFIPGWNLWIEMKRQKGGSISAHQKSWLSYLIDCGHSVEVCFGCDDAKRKVVAFNES